MPNEEENSSNEPEVHETPEIVEVHQEEDDAPQTSSSPETAELPKPTDEPSPEPTPVVAPESTTHLASPTPAVAATPAPAHSTAGVLVLQWLTYAFWGWLILALVWLATVVLSNAILNEADSGMVPYAIAASIVLLPLAFVTDLFYRKHEPLKKAGGAVIIMVIHTVLFALLGIITLIVTVFTALNIAIDTGDVNSRMVTLITFAFATVLYASAFLRTLNPFKSRKPLFLYGIVMVVLTALLLIFAVVGPLAKNYATRNDRLIEQNLTSVETSINSYVTKNKKLPNSLNDVAIISQGGKTLVEKGLVEYKKEADVMKMSGTDMTTEHRYQLCVEYAQPSQYGYESSSYYQSDDEYSTYVSTSRHDAGKQCYKLQATTYNFDEKM